MTEQLALNGLLARHLLHLMVFGELHLGNDARIAQPAEAEGSPLIGVDHVLGRAPGCDIDVVSAGIHFGSPDRAQHAVLHVVGALRWRYCEVRIPCS